MGGIGGGKGGSGGSSTTTQTSPYAPALWAMANQRNKATMPVLNTLSAETQNALQTGGVNSGEPLINRQTDAQREAASQGMEITRQNLARTGLSGTSFAQQILGTQGQSNSENIANVGPNVANQFVAGAPSIGLNSSGLDTAASAANLDSTQTFSPGFWALFNQGLQSGSSLPGIGSLSSLPNPMSMFGGAAAGGAAAGGASAGGAAIGAGGFGLSDAALAGGGSLVDLAPLALAA